MKHAGADALNRLQPLLAGLRAIPALKEKTPGAFYLAGRAALHFHEHDDDLFADLRLATDASDFERLRVTTKTGQSMLLSRVRKVLA